MTKISNEEVKKVAKLARLELNENQIQNHAKQLEKILDYIKQLETINTDNVPCTTRAIEVVNVLRKDEQKNYPVPNKDGEFYKSRLDIEGAQIFKSTEFLDACKAMGIVDDKRELKIKDGVFGNA